MSDVDRKTNLSGNEIYDERVSSIMKMKWKEVSWRLRLLVKMNLEWESESSQMCLCLLLVEQWKKYQYPYR